MMHLKLLAVLDNPSIPNPERGGIRRSKDDKNIQSVTNYRSLSQYGDSKSNHRDLPEKVKNLRRKAADPISNKETPASKSADPMEKIIQKRRTTNKKGTKKIKKSKNGISVSRRYERLPSDACTNASSDKFSTRTPRREKGENIKNSTGKKKDKKNIRYERLTFDACTNASSDKFSTRTSRKEKGKNIKNSTGKKKNKKSIRYERLTSDACTNTSFDKFSTRTPRKEKGENMKNSMGKKKKKKRPQKTKLRGDVATQSNELNTHPTASRTKTPSTSRTKQSTKDSILLQVVKPKGVPSTITFINTDSSYCIDSECSSLSDPGY